MMHRTSHCHRDQPLPVDGQNTAASAEHTGASRDGVLVVDKPQGMTSFSVVNLVKRWLRLRKAGHCGTLDPLATGVLVICVNQATRIAGQLLDHEKTYRFTMRLGVETDTLDQAGQVTDTCQGPPVAESELEAALEGFRGLTRQQVPRYAAVKVKGRRLYDYARSGVEVDRPERQVHIHRLELVDFQWPHATLEVHCSKGTYIRQLAADVGRVLGCGAHITALRRLASGPFDLEGALDLEQIKAWRGNGRWVERLVPLHAALAHLPVISIDDEELLHRLKDGHLDPAWEVRTRKDFGQWHDAVRLMTAEDRLVALWWPQPPAGQRRLRVFQ